MPDKYPLGLNINMGALRNWGALVTTCKMLNSSHHLAMISASGNAANDVDSVKRLHEEIGDSALMWIIRFYDSREGEWFRFKNQEWFADYCAAIKHHFPNVVFDSEANEPGVPPEDIPAFVAYQMKIINLFKERNLTYLAMCYGMGSPAWEHVLRGDFDDILYNADGISEHHYTMAWLEAGSGYPYEILLDPATLSQYWRTKWEIQEGHFLVRRSDYWALRCQLLGIPMPDVYLTELILDQNPNAVSYLNNTYSGVWDSMRYQYGLEEYNFDLRGLNTYPNYYKEVFPNLSYDEALAKIHIHLVEDCFNVPYLKTGQIFAWNQIWDIPMGTDASRPERRPFFILLSNHAKTYTKGTAPLPPVEPEPIPVPVPTEPIDLLPYLRGDGRIYDMHYSWAGTGTQRIQTQVDDKRFFQVKGHPEAVIFEWEELWADENYIYRGTDVSPGPVEIYQVYRQTGIYGENWFHRFAKIGDTLRSAPNITFRNRTDGSPVAEKPTYAFPHWIEFTEFHPKMTFKSDIALDNVAELTGYLDNNGAKGTAFEVYYYAKDYGLVAWKDPLTSRESYISEQGINVPDLPRLKLAWLTLPEVPDSEPPQEKPPMFYATLSGRRKSDGGPVRTNIRSSRSTASPILGELPPFPDFINGFAADADTEETNDYIWREIRLQDENGVDVISGFVADSLVEVLEIVELPPDARRYYDFAGATLYMTPTAKAEFDTNLQLILAAFAAIEPRPLDAEEQP